MAPVLPALLDDDGPTPVVAHDVALATGSGVDAALQEGRRAGRNWYRWGAVLCDALRCAEEPGAGDEETWETFMARAAAEYVQYDVRSLLPNK